MTGGTRPPPVSLRGGGGGAALLWTDSVTAAAGAGGGELAVVSKGEASNASIDSSVPKALAVDVKLLEVGGLAIDPSPPVARVLVLGRKAEAAEFPEGVSSSWPCSAGSMDLPLLLYAADGRASRSSGPSASSSDESSSEESASRRVGPESDASMAEGTVSSNGDEEASRGVEVW